MKHYLCEFIRVWRKQFQEKIKYIITEFVFCSELYYRYRSLHSDEQKNHQSTHRTIGLLPLSIFFFQYFSIMCTEVGVIPLSFAQNPFDLTNMELSRTLQISYCH